MPSSRPGLPAEARRSLFVYNLFFPLVFVFLLPGFLLRMFRRGGFRSKFGQRLARYDAEDLARWGARSWVWVHSISVGETFVALKVARELHERMPDVGILLSTTTSTGFAEAAKARCDWLEPIYNPIDSASIVREALDRLEPRQLVLIEGEAWPNLVAECVRRGIPVSLVNARLSPRSERRFRTVRHWTGPIFRLLDRICVPEPADVERWASLGVDRSRVIVTGSVKFDQTSARSTRVAQFRGLLEAIGVTEQAPILVAGSTWEPEESVMVELLPKLRRDFPDLFLILVPRHVERCPELLRKLDSTGLRIIRRSELPAAAGPADVLLVDTTGELRDWYALATVVFVGKSLPGVSEVGGQNPAEPALLGKPVVYGPHMENFESLVVHLKRTDATVQVESGSELEAVFRRMLADSRGRAEFGSRAIAALSGHSGATKRTVEALLAASH